MTKLIDVIKTVKALLSGVKLTQEPLVDGSIIQYTGENISLSEVVYLMAGADNWSVLPDGAYITKTSTNFTITEGIVSAITEKVAQAIEQKPILQAQSAEQETLETTVEELKEEVKEITEEVKLADATVSVDINTVLQPVYDRLSSIENSISLLQDAISSLASLYVTQESFSKAEEKLSNTQVALSKVSDMVMVIAKEPAAQPIEKEVTNFSANKVPQDVRESMTYKVAQFNHIN